jgi:hypothetical protein
MTKTIWFVLILPLSLLVASCVSSPEGHQDQSQISRGTNTADTRPVGTINPESGSSQTSTPATDPASTRISLEIDALMVKAKESLEANRLAEGMQFYISALGRASRAGIKNRTEELTGIINATGAKLTIEPHEGWIANDGSQRAGDVRSAARGEGLMPTVYLYESYGFGKSVVPDAMIRFEFVNNEGKLNDTVRTDPRGMANTIISSIASPGRDATVRAFPIFSAEGYTYALRTVFREFSYLAPPNIALVMALERTPSGFNENPRVLDAVASSLKPLGVQTISYNGVMAPERFMSAFGGDSNALAAFTGSSNPGYFALLFVEVGPPVQMQLQGRVYNIFTATGKATIRIVRADGTIIFAEAKDGIRGQGGSEQAAIDDCLVKIRSDMTTLLETRAEAIQKAFLD